MLLPNHINAKTTSSFERKISKEKEMFEIIFFIFLLFFHEKRVKV